MLFMPPRHGKSEQGSRRLPAYIFGRKPHAAVIATSYSADLAKLMNRDVQRIIDTPIYGRIFPQTQLCNRKRTDATLSKNQTWIRNSDLFEIVGHRGYYRCAGVGGGITGMGCDFGLIDDPIKNAEEAASEVYREKVWEWYVSTFRTRLSKHGQQLLIMTRWHEDDLAGRLLQLAKSNANADQWRVVSFPAISSGNRRRSAPGRRGAVAAVVSARGARAAACALVVPVRRAVPAAAGAGRRRPRQARLVQVLPRPAGARRGRHLRRLRVQGNEGQRLRRDPGVGPQGRESVPALPRPSPARLQARSTRCAR
jgi:hypothetical protein